MTTPAEPAPGALDRPAPIPGPVVDHLLLEVGSWLETPPAGAGADVGRRDEASRAALRRVIAAHGLGPYLASAPGLEGLRGNLPAGESDWLEAQLAANRQRLGRLHEDLAAVLAELARAGVRTMPLKGAIVTTRAGATPERRPMADLDLLVAPADRAPATAALVRRGYLLWPHPHRRPTHDVFEHAGDGGLVRSYDGEHPDNPRRIELHTEVRRHLWTWVDDDDLTAYLWSSSRDGSLLGQPAALPSDEALLAHLAIHATCDLLLGRGRLIQWLDVAAIAAALPGGLGGLPNPRLAYPALRLAARRLPLLMAGVDLVPLGALVPPDLRRWTATVPLDRAAGLQSGRFLPTDAATFGARWRRWAPYRWRLRVAHGDAPLPVATARHLGRLVATASRRGGAGS